MELDYISIGKRLQESRKAAGFTQKELADIMGVSVSYIKSTERGSKPSLHYLSVVADSCKKSLDWLLTGVHPFNGEQNEEGVFDPDKKDMYDMIDAVKLLMSDPDPEIRIWAKIQFKKAFPGYLENVTAVKKNFSCTALPKQPSRGDFCEHSKQF